ncbi:hypothetical protein NMG60_11005383 [Bertholletia excelsa]
MAPRSTGAVVFCRIADKRVVRGEEDGPQLHRGDPRQRSLASLQATSSSFLSTSRSHHQQPLSLFHSPNRISKTPQNLRVFKVHAAKLPAGVELPKVEPKFTAPLLGFARTAEIWNSRACMIGLVGVFVILNKGILQLIGVDVGIGFDLPL